MESIENRTVNASRKYRSYTFEDRLKAVSMKEAGMSSLEIGERMGIDSSLIRGWVRRYRKDGANGLRPVSHRRTIGVHFPDIPAQECPFPEGNEVQQRKGFIHYVDNPGLMRSMTSSLNAFGVTTENITTGMDSYNFSNTLEEGDTLVVNSLFDLSSNLGGILSSIVHLIKKGVSVISISDGGIRIGKEDTDITAVISALRQYADTSINAESTAQDAYGCDPYGYYGIGSSEKEKSFRNALELYKKGFTMTHATRTAGCSYSAFRYWFSKRNQSHDTIGTQTTTLNESKEII